MKDPAHFYYFVFAVFIVCALVIRRIAESSFGKSLLAIKQNPVRAQYLGYNTGMYKCSVYVISGFFAGLSGALYCFLTQSAFASVLDWTKSGDVVIATLLGGGTVSFYGPIVGSVIFIVAQELLQRLLGALGSALRAFLCRHHPGLPHGAHGDAETEIKKRNTMSFLSVEGLTKRFGDLVAVDQVSLEIEKEGVLSIIGPNGGGQDDVFQPPDGFYRPTAAG